MGHVCLSLRLCRASHSVTACEDSLLWFSRDCHPEAASLWLIKQIHVTFWDKKSISVHLHQNKGVQHFGVSGPHWKKNCLGPYIKYVLIHNRTKKSHSVVSKFTILCSAAFIAILGCMRTVGHRLDALKWIFGF